MGKNKHLSAILLPAFSIYLAALLWVTLLMRIGTFIRHIYFPFWSYKAAITGDFAILIQILENILLFVPFGFLCSSLFQWPKKRVIITACIFSILIEAAQWIFWLGESEFDDVLHNTLGAWIGCQICSHHRIEKTHPNKRAIVFSFMLFFILCAIPLYSSYAKRQQMTHYASLYDRPDGTKNLLVLNGDAGPIKGTEVYASYNDDGSLTIEGTSNDRGQKQIGMVLLEPGTYCFSGLYGTDCKDIVLDLETQKNNQFIRLTPDIGPNEITTFELSETTLVGAYVGVYNGSRGTCTARPAIYFERPIVNS